MIGLITTTSYFTDKLSINNLNSLSLVDDLSITKFSNIK